MLKKMTLVSLLSAITVISAYGQEGQWRHFAQINPDTLTANGLKFISNNNNLWALWTHKKYTYDTTMLYASRFGIDMYNNNILWDREYFKYFYLFRDTRGEAHLIADIGPMLTKNGMKYFTTGIFEAVVEPFDTLWGQLELKDSMRNYLGAGPTANSGDSTVLLWCEENLSWPDRPGEIHSNIYKPDIGWGQKRCEAFGDDFVNNEWPIVITDVNGKVWKGWVSWNSTTGFRYFTVDYQIIDTSYVWMPQLVADNTGTIAALWISRSDSVIYRINKSGTWQPRELLTFADNIMSVRDGCGATWIAKTFDNIISITTYDSLGWGNWDSLTYGYLSHMSIDQMGNPVIGYFNGNNIYSLIYCKDTIAPWVQITSPVADSIYYKSQTLQLQFNHSSDVAFLNVYCQREGNSEWQNIFDMISRDSLVNWTVPDDSANYRFKTEAIDSGWNNAYDSTGWFLVSPQGVSGKPDGGLVGYNFSINNIGPNPFRRSANISFSIDKMCNVKLSIYNSLGQLVKVLYNDCKVPGNYQIKWDGNNSAGKKASPGVYFCHLNNGNKQLNIKLVKLE